MGDFTMTKQTYENSAAELAKEWHRSGVRKRNVDLVAEIALRRV